MTMSSSHLNRQSLPSRFNPAFDIHCDRDPHAYNSPGTVFARSVVKKYLPEFCRQQELKSSRGKGNVFTTIIEEIRYGEGRQRQQQRPRQFYKRGQQLMTETEIRHRVGHWVRDALRTRQPGPSSSSSSSRRKSKKNKPKKKKKKACMKQSKGLIHRMKGTQEEAISIKPPTMTFGQESSCVQQREGVYPYASVVVPQTSDCSMVATPESCSVPPSASSLVTTPLLQDDQISPSSSSIVEVDNGLGAVFQQQIPTSLHDTAPGEAFQHNLTATSSASIFDVFDFPTPEVHTSPVGDADEMLEDNELTKQIFSLLQDTSPSHFTLTTGVQDGNPCHETGGSETPNPLALDSLTDLSNNMMIGPLMDLASVQFLSVDEENDDGFSAHTSSAVRPTQNILDNPSYDPC